MKSTPTLTRVHAEYLCRKLLRQPWHNFKGSEDMATNGIENSPLTTTSLLIFT